MWNWLMMYASETLLNDENKSFSVQDAILNKQVMQQSYNNEYM